MGAAGNREGILTVATRGEGKGENNRNLCFFNFRWRRGL